MTRFDRSVITDDRYRAYDRMGHSGRRSDRDEIWLFTPDLCRSMLGSAAFSSRRESLVCSAQEAGFQELSRFFAHWLMYSEGPEHLTRRAAVFAAIRRVREVWEFPDMRSLIESLPGRFDAVTDYSEPFVWATLPKFLGLDSTEQEYWKSRIGKIVILPGLESPDNAAFQEAQQSLRELRSRLHGREAILFFRALEKELPSNTPRDTIVDLMINVIGDSIHPTSSALATEIWLRHISENSSLNGKLPFLFHSEAPFQYSARKAVIDSHLDGKPVFSGQRVVACLGQANRLLAADKEIRQKWLTFGHGRHACPGRSLALECVAQGFEIFLRSFSGRLSLAAPPKWIDSVGYRALASLKFQRLDYQE